VTAEGVIGMKEVFGICGREVDAWWDVGGRKVREAWEKKKQTANLAAISSTVSTGRGKNPPIV